MSIDVLIVGQGLAGSILAWYLLRDGFSVLVIDDGLQSASRVAAGLINPVTGQRLVKTDHVDVLLPAAMRCYRELAEYFHQSFFVPMPMLRWLPNVKLRRIAEQRLGNHEYQRYLEGIFEADAFIEGGVGILRQRQTGYLRTESLLTYLKQYLLERGAYRQTIMEYANIRLQPDLAWLDIEPRHIVFCEGHHARQNPWFAGLPFQVAKGEILTCRTSVANPAAIINYGEWLLPLDERHCKIGATFDSDVQTIEPDLQARERLLSSVARVMPSLLPLEVIEQRVGIRPTTLDKQPFIGTHPRHATLHIFNGFGAKGSLAIPWYAQHFCAWLKDGLALPRHCDIRRYHDTHFPA